MTELHFKGKEFVYNHHLAVPYRPLVPDESKSIGSPVITGNLIIQGDNLHALKALLPIYADKVNCIFIDPPYNTGNEGWSYNDNVNAPIIKEWLESNPIGIEDGMRHDKWCAMMWPRLRLLHELMADDGVIFICIDDNELFRLQQIMLEIFGAENFVCCLISQSNPRGRSLDRYIAKTHEYILVFAKNYLSCNLNELPKDKESLKEYCHSDEKGNYRLLELRNRNPVFNRKNRRNLFYPIWTDINTGSVSLNEGKNHTEEVLPINSKNEDGCWTWGKEKFINEINLVIAKKTRNGKWRIFRKDYVPKNGATSKAKSLWLDKNINNENGKKLLGNIFGKPVFDFPKSIDLIKKALAIGANPNALVLDSFAGSGTTAHAVIEANNLDGGNRKFILVEMDSDISDNVTAERIRLVNKGYSFEGIKKTELLREKINWQNFKKSDDLLKEIAVIETLHANNFDSINKTINDGVLIVTGVANIQTKIKGLGGNFTYCTLGNPIDLDKILNGKNLPDYHAIAPVLFHMATNQTLDPATINVEKFYIGKTENEHVWMIYRPDLNWLKSDEAALTLTRAIDIQKKDSDKQHLVFAPARFVSQKVLKEESLKISFVPFPDALYRIVRD